MRHIVDAVLTVIAILFICALAIVLTGCASAPVKPPLPYSYPVYAMPHGNEFHPNVVEENPILLDLPIIP